MTNYLSEIIDSQPHLSPNCTFKEYKYALSNATKDILHSCENLTDNQGNKINGIIDSSNALPLFKTMNSHLLHYMDYIKQEGHLEILKSMEPAFYVPTLKDSIEVQLLAYYTLSNQPLLPINKLHETHGKSTKIFRLPTLEPLIIYTLDFSNNLKTSLLNNITLYTRPKSRLQFYTLALQHIIFPSLKQEILTTHYNVFTQQELKALNTTFSEAFLNHNLNTDKMENAIYANLSILKLTELIVKNNLNEDIIHNIINLTTNPKLTKYTIISPEYLTSIEYKLKKKNNMLNDSSSPPLHENYLSKIKIDL